MIGASQKIDRELLLKLTNHSYSLIARAAAERMVRLFGKGALQELSTNIEDSIRRGQAEILGEALRSAEMELFHVVSSR